MNVLVIAEHNNKMLSHATRHAITAGVELGRVSVLIAGFECASVVEEVKKISGVETVLVSNKSYFGSQLPEELAPLIISLSDNFDYIIATASVFGKSIMPRVAGMLDIPQVSDVTSIVGEKTFEHPVYAGNIIETVFVKADRIILTIRSTAFMAALDHDNNAEIKEVEGTAEVGLTEYISQALTQSERPAIEQAQIIVSGGRALQSKDKFESLLLPLADKLNAAIGASRAAVDSGFVPNDFQVGQTGKIVAPELYIALGISGAIQHLAGMQGSKVIVAINNDPDAPIFKIADYGLVGDIFELVPELTEKL